MVKKIISKQLGQLLIERGVITKEQLEDAIEVQKKNGGLIGQIIVKLGYASEEAIAQALTAQYGFPYLPLKNYDINPDVVKIIPKNVASQYCLIPLDKIGNSLTVAMADPLNRLAIEDIELIAGSHIQIFISTASDIREALTRSYR